MLERSEIFLTQTKKFLDNWVELGHDTCHRTHGYDAEQCHQDCQELEKGDFAEQCRKDGGLYKCCIRFWQLKVFLPVFLIHFSEETRLTAMNADTAAHCQSAPKLKDFHGDPYIYIQTNLLKKLFLKVC